MTHLLNKWPRSVPTRVIRNILNISRISALCHPAVSGALVLLGILPLVFVVRSLVVRAAREDRAVGDLSPIQALASPDIPISDPQDQEIPKEVEELQEKQGGENLISHPPCEPGSCFRRPLLGLGPGQKMRKGGKETDGG